MGLFSKLFNKESEEITQETLMEYANQKFHMEIEDVFTVTGRGTVVTGIVDSGIIRVGDIVSISGRITTEVEGIEMFRKKLDYAKAGDACGIYLKNVQRSEIEENDYLTK